MDRHAHHRARQERVGSGQVPDRAIIDADRIERANLARSRWPNSHKCPFHRARWSQAGDRQDLDVGQVEVGEAVDLLGALVDVREEGLLGWRRVLPVPDNGSGFRVIVGGVLAGNESGRARRGSPP